MLATSALLFACADPLTADAEQAVKRRLRDPESAQFRDMTRCERPGINGIRGEVNAKNSAGGYAGFAAFIYIDGNVAILPPMGQGAGDIQTYETPLAQWDALFRRCNSDAANGAVDNASRASDAAAANAAASDAANAANEAEAAANAAAAAAEADAAHFR